jgi:hypothetical protein
MTVAEYIKYLKQFNPNLEVMVLHDESGFLYEAPSPETKKIIQTDAGFEFERGYRAGREVIRKFNAVIID